MVPALVQKGFIMSRRSRNGWAEVAFGLVCGSACGLGGGMAACLTVAAGIVAAAAPASVASAEAALSGDELIFKDGKTLTGTIVSETETKIRFKGAVAGIPFEAEYDKADLLTIKRAADGGGKDPSVKDPAVKDPAVKSPSPLGDPSSTLRVPTVETTPGEPVVYIIELKGDFGEDISETPIRQAVKDARRLNANHLIFILDSKWEDEIGQKLSDDTASFDQIFRAEKMTPIFAEEIPRDFEPDPTVVFWVKEAMGGASMLPFVCKNIYMAPKARIGGLGNLTRAFGGMGDEVVRQKQYSLRLAHAEGWVNVGGYDVRLMRALAAIEYVLSVRFEGGRPVYIEAMPDPLKGEILLTDDGKDERMDAAVERVRGDGNDVLTLNADLAQQLLVSKGTVSTLDELYFQLGIERTKRVVPGRSRAITEGWARDVDDAKKRIRRLWEEFGEVQVQGDYQERSQARATQLRKIDDIIGIGRRFEESITGRFYQQYQIPMEPQLNQLKEQIKLAQVADRR